ncbi:AAA family ATPase [Longispora sp. K20-0274]|uniref:AAA family ATPase n=1 Tax=Longispora sp. K20-0274 TaxID=3088255 RepID=UPI00399AAD70
MIFGRAAERRAIDALLAGCRAGTSGALVLSGEPGIGKSHLLGYTAEHAGLPLLRGTGIESEAELPFAGLHMLLRPALDRLDALPGRQRAALRAAFGLDEGSEAAAPDRLLTGLAVLTLLSEVGPVLCLVDDAQWLDRSSAEALLFAARRLDSEGVGLLLAARPGFAAPGLPTLTLAGLEPEEAAALLDAREGDLSPTVRYRVLAEAHGNPLALRELPASLAPGPGPVPLTDRLQLAFHSQAAALPPATRTLLLIAAADDTGDPGLILRAGALLGAGLADVAPAEHLLAEGDGTVTFRHPLVRAAVYQGAPLLDRIAAHRALAAALAPGPEHPVPEHPGPGHPGEPKHPRGPERPGGPENSGRPEHPGEPRRSGKARHLGEFAHPGDPERRAWHLAAAATGPDEEVAAALGRAAERSRARSGYAAAAAAYERAARLSPDPVARARRLTLAAGAAMESGDLDGAGRLADEAADARPAESPTPATTINARASHATESLAGGDNLDGHPRNASRVAPGKDTSELALLRATIGFRQGDFRAAHRLLIAGAESAGMEATGTETSGVEATHSEASGAESAAPDRATRLLIQAFHTAWYTDQASVIDVVARMAVLPPSPVIRFLVAAVSPLTGRPAPVGDTLDAALAAVADSPRDLATVLGGALVIGRDDVTRDRAAELAAAGRAEGRFGLLPTVLFFLAEGELFAGRHAAAEATAREAVRIAEDTGQRQWLSQVNGLLTYLAAVRGDEEACRGYAAAARRAEAGGPWTDWGLGMLDLGAGRVEAALHRFEGLTGGPLAFHVSATRCVPDLVEAAVRLGRPERAVAPLARFEDWAGHTDQPWARALVLRCRALLTGEEADYAAAHRAAQPAPDPTDPGSPTDPRGRTGPAGPTSQAGPAGPNDPHGLHGPNGPHGPAGQRPERPFERARTDLLYGEWLRRGRRKAEARGPLRTAMEVFERLGAVPWAARARAELGATGETVPAPRSGPLAALTPQELAIVHLAAQGLSNRDIAARLFLSPRTVGHHLYRAYPKLGILSRGELAKLVA